MISLDVEKINFIYATNSNGTEPFQLKDISFRVQEGTFLSILGPNGSGKSTLLKIIDKILIPHSGSVKVFGIDYNQITRKELSKLIAFVPQSSPLNFPFTVFETVLMGRSPFSSGIGFESETDRNFALNAMQQTDIIHLANREIMKLSGGEIQRVYLARAITQQAQILILDEPNTHLDLRHQIEILSLIKNLTIKNQKTVIAVFHDLNLATLFSDEILILKEGRIFAYGKPENVINRENIKEVFNTETIIDLHPIRKIPRITLNPN